MDDTSVTIEAKNMKLAACIEWPAGLTTTKSKINYALGLALADMMDKQTPLMATSLPERLLIEDSAERGNDIPAEW